MNLGPFFMWLIVVLFWPTPAWAVQVHMHPEGYLVHMMAHIFFSAALIYFLYTLHTSPPDTGLPWRHLKISFLLFLVWNVDTFVVHWLSHGLSQDAIASGANLFDDVLLGPMDTKRIIYYLGRFDHLLCVPAMWYLMSALARFYDQAKREQTERNEEAAQ